MSSSGDITRLFGDLSGGNRTVGELDRALTKLAEWSKRPCQVVECRFFGGLKHEEVDEALGVSLPTVRRDG